MVSLRHLIAFCLAAAFVRPSFVCAAEEQMEAVWIVAAVVAGPVIVEVVGYFWHRFAEHDGVFGQLLRERHIIHHESLYPLERLLSPRNTPYLDAQSWTWYAVAGVVSVVLFFLVPLPFFLTAFASGVVYGRLIAYAHSAYHIAGHPLQRFGWFRRLNKLHFLHHYERANYGILFFAMDRLFGTYRTTRSHSAVEQFPGLERQQTTGRSSA